jgi:hypothetical protein
MLGVKGIQTMVYKIKLYTIEDVDEESDFLGKIVVLEGESFVE